MTTLTCHASVMYLNTVDALISTRTGAAEEAWGRAEYRLGGLKWRMELPRGLVLSTEVCAMDDGMDFMLGLCHESLADVIDLLQQVKSGRIGLDIETSQLLSGRSETWEQHARDFWTVVVHALLSHREGDDALRARVQAALCSPPPSSKRSWPSKQAFAELRAHWETLPLEARINMTVLSSREFWFVQACDIAIASSVVSGFKKQELDVDKNRLLEQLRRQCKISSSLDVQFDPLPKICINAEFAAEPGCLEEIHRRAVWHRNEKNAVLRAALFCNFEVLCRRSCFVVTDLSFTWADMDRLVATLILEALLHWHSMNLRADAFVQKALAKLHETTLRKLQRRQEKRRATQARKATETAAMLSAQRASQLTERELHGPEANSVRQAEEARRRGEERRQERLHIRHLLAQWPSWDVSCLQVYNSFLSAPPPEKLSTRYHEW